MSQRLVKKTKSPRTGMSPPVVIRGALYGGAPDDNRIYLYGGTTSWQNTSFPGFVPPQPAKYSLWSYDTTSEIWDQSDITSASPQRPSSGAYAEAPDQSLAFYFNGRVDSGSSKETYSLGNGVRFLEGMVVINTNNQTARNFSTSTVSGGFPRAGGRLQYIPNIGKKGILVHIGGTYKSVSSTDGLEEGVMVEMDMIDVFDIESVYKGSNGDWYKQQATGDIPPPRVDHCLVMASAPDNSSHNIYMYGGRLGSREYYDDVHVLSLPSFIWTKVYNGTSLRFGMTCHAVGKRQMIVVGGHSNLDLSQLCEWRPGGVSIFDMSTISWGGVFNYDAGPYIVPAELIGTIGGNVNGSATAKMPMKGWTNTSLAIVFGASPPSESGNKDGPKGPEATPTPSPRFDKGKIAAIIVGVVVGVILIAGAFKMYRLKRTAPEKAITEADTGGSADATGNPPGREGTLQELSAAHAVELPARNTRFKITI